MEEQWSPEKQQVMALACALGAFIGIQTRAKMFWPDAAEKACRHAERLMPKEAAAFGPQALALMRATAIAVRDEP